ncbi:MAG TPA: hypothetical protein VKK61_11705 [Tepidisphaeraceae bacterium]|nr:hypothetical protein [Tepidisphaeraceae bacterium]
MWLLAEQMVETSKDEFKQGYGGLIFMGLFFLALIIIAIWWLKRGA